MAAPKNPNAPAQLTPWAKQNLQTAASKGNLDKFLANHQKIAAQQQAVTAGGTKAQQNYQQQLQAKNVKNTGAPGTGASGAKGGGGAPAAAPPPAPPANAPPKGGAGAAPPPAPAPPPAAPSTGAPAQGAGGGKAPAKPTFKDAFENTYGAGSEKQFGNMQWYGDNPIETARKAAQRGLDENLANVRNRYAQSGFGTSGREALSEGQAVGDFATKFGDIAAERGLNARNTDLDRLATMMATGGSQDLQAQQLALQMNEQLMKAGTGLTGVGTSEQTIPNADLLTTLLTNMSKQETYGHGATNPPAK